MRIQHEELLKLPDIEKQAVDGDRKTQSLVTWTYKNKNLFMYNPESVGMSFDEMSQQKSKKSIVVHSSTRFSRLPFSEQDASQAIAEAAALQAKQFEGRVGPDGKAITGPMINGYPMVSLTPSPAPGAILGTPLMTWGEIEVTPFRLNATPNRTDPYIDGIPQFKVPDLPPSAKTEQNPIRRRRETTEKRLEQVPKKHERTWNGSQHSVIGT